MQGFQAGSDAVISFVAVRYVLISIYNYCFFSK